MKIDGLMEAGAKGLVNRYHRSQFAKLCLALTTLCVLLVSIPSIVYASTLISQSFSTATALSPGTIVSLEKNSTDQVSSATNSNSNYMIGVTISSGSSQISISSDQTNQVQVATSGVEQVLVSNINGNISAGDPITASPISGIGMKATENTKVIGLAQDTFPNSTSTQESYTSQGGQKQSVLLGEVPVLLNVAYYYKQPNKTLIPPALQSLANALAGKSVNSLPIIVSIVIFVVSLLIVVIIVYSMIRSSIISVGRNPMSQAAVYRNVIQLSALVVVILGVAIISIYMVLTKF
jgi:hypothetical protein